MPKKMVDTFSAKYHYFKKVYPRRTAIHEMKGRSQSDLSNTFKNIVIK